MTRKISECCDQWNDMQTMLIADSMEDAEFTPLLNNCSSLDDFENGVRDSICAKIADNQAACEDIPDETLRYMALAALSTIDIDKLVQAVISCFEPELRIFRLESRVNRLCNLMMEKKKIKNERDTTSANDGELAAFDIAVNFDKDKLNINSEVDVKNKKDAWILRLVYNDGNQENLSMVKPNDDKDDYVMTSDKDKLNAKFSDDPEDGTLKVPQTVIDHIAKHIKQAESNIEDNKKHNDKDLAQEIVFDIKKEFPNYDMEVIDGDVGSNQWNIEIVYPNGDKDKFTINKLGTSYIMKSSDMFIAKYSLDELKNFPAKMKEHIEKHLKRG